MAGPTRAGAMAGLKEQVEDHDKGQEDAQERVLGGGRAAGAADDGDEHEAEAHEHERKKGVDEPERQERQPYDEPYEEKAVHNVASITAGAFAHKRATQVPGTALVAKVSMTKRANDVIAARIKLNGLCAMGARLGDARYFSFGGIRAHAFRKGCAGLIGMDEAVGGAEVLFALRAYHIDFGGLHSADMFTLRTCAQ